MPSSFPLHLPGRPALGVLLLLALPIVGSHQALASVPGPPTVTNFVLSTGSPAAGDPVVVTVTFSEPVQNVTRDDFTITAPVNATVVPLNVRNPSMDQTTYELTVYAATLTSTGTAFYGLDPSTTDIVDVDEDLALTGPPILLGGVTIQPFDTSVTFTNPGEGDFFDAANWDSGRVPGNPLESFIIENGGLASGFSGPGVPSAVQYNSILAGSSLGVGGLQFNGVDVEGFGPFLFLGSLVFPPFPPDPFQLGGALRVRNTDLVRLPPEVLIGSPLSGIQTDLETNIIGELSLTDVETVRVEVAPAVYSTLIPGQSLIRAGRMTGLSFTANADVFGRFDLEFRNIDTFDFVGGFGGLQLGAIDGDATDTATGFSRVRTTGNLLAESIGQMNVFQVSIGTIENVFDGNQLVVSATFRDVQLNAQVLTFGNMRLEEPRQINSTVNVRFEDTHVALTGAGFALLGVVDDTPDSVGSTAECNITLLDSTLVAPTCWVGIYTPTGGTPQISKDLATLGTYTTSLELDASFLHSDDFQLGEDSTLTFKLKGETPATLTNVEAGARLHAVLQATDARIAGEVIIDFDFVPDLTPDTPIREVNLDLIVTGSSTALDDFSGTIVVRDRPDNVFLNSFSVVTRGGVDVLRLTYFVADSPYNIWAEDRIATAAQRPIQLDPNNDSQLNGAHFAFDTNPLAGGGLPNEGKFRQRFEFSPERSGQVWTLTFPVRANAVFPNPTPGSPVVATVDGITYTVQGFTDLKTPTRTTIFEITPALDDGMPPLGSYSGLSESDYVYRTFAIDGTRDTIPDAFLNVQATFEVP